MAGQDRESDRVNPAAYAALVKEERAALAKLQRLLKAWGSNAALAQVEHAWNKWADLAAMVESEPPR